tara:strand:- start:2638 stop:3021 length:384 start_codon:yes stop_codon:yes gene_type:complete
MKKIDRKEYLNNIKEIFKDSKEYINNYDINNEIFESFGFVDSSWHNDLCPSYNIISKDEQKNITVHFPNSENDNVDNEEFNTFNLYNSFNSSDDGLMIFVDTIEEIFSIIKSNQNELNDYLNKKREV